MPIIDTKVKKEEAGILKLSQPSFNIQTIANLERIQSICHSVRYLVLG